MSTRTTIDGDITIPLDGFEGDRPRGCQWDESVCTSSPEYRVVRGAHGHEHDVPDVDVFCARHYALDLARLVEVHLPSCTASAAEHVTGFEKI